MHLSRITRIATRKFLENIYHDEHSQAPEKSPKNTPIAATPATSSVDIPIIPVVTAEQASDAMISILSRPTRDARNPGVRRPTIDALFRIVSYW